MKKIINIGFCVCLWITFFFQYIYAQENENIGLATQAGSAYVFEYNSEKVVFAKNENEKLFPASMTKMMGLLLIYEQLHAGKLSFDDMVVTSANAASMGGSQVYLEENETMSVRDLVESICIASANDAMVAMAEKIGGSHEHFVEMMNTKAKQLKMTNTHFVNATGLHDENHYTTAKDMGILAKALLAEGQDDLLAITSTYDAYIREDSEQPFWLVNTNKLLRQYPGVDGLKSGYTSQAKSCITITAKKDGVRLIAVVMKEPDSKTRNQEIMQLLDYGFQKFNVKTLYKKGQEVGNVFINNAKVKEVSVYAKQDISLVYENENDVKVTKEEIILTKQKAPYKKGEVIAKLQLQLQDGSLLTSDLYIEEDIEAIQYVDVFMQTLQKIFV